MTIARTLKSITRATLTAAGLMGALFADTSQLTRDQQDAINQGKVKPLPDLTAQLTPSENAGQPPPQRVDRNTPVSVDNSGRVVSVGGKVYSKDELENAGKSKASALLNSAAAAGANGASDGFGAEVGSPARGPQAGALKEVACDYTQGLIANLANNRTPGSVVEDDSPLTGPPASSPISYNPPTSSVPRPNPPAMNDVIDAGNRATADELLRNAEAMMNRKSREAFEDQTTLSRKYDRISLAEARDRLRAASKGLATSARRIAEAKESSIEPGERGRFENLYLTASDKAKLAADGIDEQMGVLRAPASRGGFPAAEPDSLMDALSGPPKLQNPLGQLPGVGVLFSPTATVAGATRNDALVDRLIMFDGLPPDQKAAVAGDLKLKENALFTGPDGKREGVTILHNGYLLGGSGSSLDCSSFVSAALPADVRKGRFTTMDFRAMWIYRKMGWMERPPHYPAKRAEAIKETAQAFNAIDVYAGERLFPGDLLVYRLIWDPYGHVFIVKDYDAKLKTARVLEAAQSAGGIREREFGLTYGAQKRNPPLIRPGLFVLRLKPINQRACTYRDPRASGARRTPAAATEPALTPTRGGTGGIQ